MNPPDPASVKALLEQLRVSQAWQEIQASAVSTSPDATASVAAASEGDATTAGPSSATATVAELLAQLKSPPHTAASVPRYDLPAPQPPQQAPPTPQSPPITRPDTKHRTFQHALPLIARLGEDPAFLNALSEMRAEQNRLEDQLWAEREAIHHKYTDKVKAAQIKATMIGAGITAHEARMLQDAYQRELRKFDQGRVLHAWESLISKQQARLESLGVPNMSVGSQQQVREKQAQIMQVLVGLLD